MRVAILLLVALAGCSTAKPRAGDEAARSAGAAAAVVAPAAFGF